MDWLKAGWQSLMKVSTDQSEGASELSFGSTGIDVRVSPKILKFADRAVAR